MNRRSAAEWVTYLLEPKNWIIATTLAVGWHAAGAPWAGLGGGGGACSPGCCRRSFINRGIRDGRWADRNVGAKRPRLIVLSFIIASVAVGLALMVGLGAPTELSGYFACMLGSIAVLAAITTVWKISIHCAVASGSVTILALLFGAVAGPGVPAGRAHRLVAGGAQGPHDRPGDRGLAARRGRRRRHLRADPAPVTVDRRLGGQRGQTRAVSSVEAVASWRSAGLNASELTAPRVALEDAHRLAG